MPLTTVALALPFVYWIILSALAVGSLAFVALTGLLSDATRGYLGFTGFLAGVLAALALLVDLGLGDAAGLAIRSAPTELDLLRRLALGTLVALALAHTFVAGRAQRRTPVAVLGLAAGATALAAAGWGWAQSAPDAVPFVIQLVSLSLATGGALAALVLGHWYLVTPRVSERPLLLQTRLLSGVIVLQVALFLTWALFGGGPGQTPFESLTGGAALLGWLRLVVTLLFPLALTVMAWATARTRSMESATGLLYIGVAAILAGTIGAGALYVSAGLLV